MDQIFGIKHNDSPSHERTSMWENKRKFLCTHCKMHGHNIEQCSKLHPKILSNKGKEIVLHNAREIRGGKENS